MDHLPAGSDDPADDAGGTPTRDSPRPTAEDADASERVERPRPPPQRIPIFPLDVVLFPGELFGLHVFEERYVLMTEEVLAEDLPIGIVLARQDQDEDRIEYEPEMVGTAAVIIRSERVEDRWLLETVGTRRFRIHEVISERPYQEAIVEWLDEDPGDSEEASRLAEELLDRVEEMGGTVDRSTDAIDDPVAVSHAVAAALPVDLETKQRLLEMEEAYSRLRAEAAILFADPAEA